MEALTGATPDISAFMEFEFLNLVYCCVEDQDFPSESNQRLAHVVGIVDNVGDALTYKLLDSETNKIIYRSAIQ